MEWKPIGDQVLLKENKRQEKTASGIIVITGMDEFVECEVIATGDGLYSQSGTKIPMTILTGMTAKIYSGNMGSQKKLQIDGVEYILVREHEVGMISVKV